MYSNTFYPLRRIISNHVPIKLIKSKPPLGARLIYRSEKAEELNYKDEPLLMSSLNQLIVHPYYNYFLPHYGNRIIAGNGMANLPISNSFTPFENSNSFLSIAAKTDGVNDLTISRKLSVKYLITIDCDSFFKLHRRKALIGGICFKGFPYTHFGINDNGENTSNFGLPREVRITCLNIPNGDYKERFSNFLDEEITSVDQRITSHSGFHYVCCDPTFATHIILELSDFPFFTSAGSVNKDGVAVTEDFFGLLIPYLYVFEYEEKTRYNKDVPFGFLGARKNELEPVHENVEWSLLNIKPDRSLEYFDFTAASIFGQQRTYELVSTSNEQEFDLLSFSDLLESPPKSKNKKGKPKKYRECFISKNVEKNEKIVLFFEQGEEFNRCLSGIRLLMPFIPKEDLQKDIDRIKQLTELFFPEYFEQAISLIPNAPEDLLERLIELLFGIPEPVKFCFKTRIRVFELDSTDGVSPINTKLDDKYSTLLTDVTIDTLSELILSSSIEGIKFRKVSTSKYFAIEFTNVGEDAAQFVVKSLKFIQSAHVSISSRAARTQQIKNLQFRIIGKGISDDYSRLGEEGFSFCIERQTAGKRGDVIFQANSIMDLLHAGVGKIFSNSRRRAVEFEKATVTNEGDTNSNYEKRISFQNSNGWRSSETGKSVDGNEFNNDSGILIKPVRSFENYGNQETRTHTNLLFPIKAGPWRFLGNYFGLISDLASRGLIKPSEVIIGANNLYHGGWGNKNWKGINKENLKILGTNAISTSPFSQMRALHDLINFQDEILNPLDLATTIGELIGGGSYLSALCGNFSSSLMFTAAGLGASIGNQPYPMFSHVTTYGTSGNIIKQAFETGYSFGQFLTRTADVTENKTIIEEGQMKRIITRKEVANTDKDRVRGAEVMWQDELVDIVTGTIPLNFDLPATASKMYYRTSDDTLRVRFGNGIGKSISVDFWFDINEEIIKDDY